MWSRGSWAWWDPPPSVVSGSKRRWNSSKFGPHVSGPKRPSAGTNKAEVMKWSEIILLLSVTVGALWCICWCFRLIIRGFRFEPSQKLSENSSGVRSHLQMKYGNTRLLYTPYISRGFYFREFRESGAIANSTTRENKFTVLSMIAFLLDREFNHSRKCLEVQIREKLDSRNIWRIQ